MSKYQEYQEALENLYYTCCDYCNFDYMKLDGEMLTNDELNDMYKKEIKPSYELLKELVERAATPKKPIVAEGFKDKSIYDCYGNIIEVIAACPSCGEQTICNCEYGTNFKFCSNCGQAIDWKRKK